MCFCYTCQFASEVAEFQFENTKKIKRNSFRGKSAGSDNILKAEWKPFWFWYCNGRLPITSLFFIMTMLIFFETIVIHIMTILLMMMMRGVDTDDDDAI